MSSNLKRRIERLEKAVDPGCDDPRINTYPNSLAEAMHMAHMSQDKLQEYLQTRRRKPSPELCDRFDEFFEQVRKD